MYNEWAVEKDIKIDTQKGQQKKPKKWYGQIEQSYEL